MKDKTILVTGDCIIDHHVYEDPTGNSGTTIVEHQGGATLLRGASISDRQELVWNIRLGNEDRVRL